MGGWGLLQVGLGRAVGWLGWQVLCTDCAAVMLPVGGYTLTPAWACTEAGAGGGADGATGRPRCSCTARSAGPSPPHRRLPAPAACRQEYVKQLDAIKAQRDALAADVAQKRSTGGQLGLRRVACAGAGGEPSLSYPS